MRLAGQLLGESNHRVVNEDHLNRSLSLSREEIVEKFGRRGIYEFPIPLGVFEMGAYLVR